MTQEKREREREESEKRKRGEEERRERYMKKCINCGIAKINRYARMP